MDALLIRPGTTCRVILPIFNSALTRLIFKNTIKRRFETCQSEKMAASNTELFPEEQVQITVKYQSREIIQQDIDCSDGCCVFYQNHTCEHAPLRKLVPLPYAGDGNDDKSRKEIDYTNRLLRGLENGLLLEYDINDHCIYAKRRCRTVVYYHSSQYHADDDPVRIETNQKVKIFDYSAFRQQFMSWLSRNYGKHKDNRESFKRHKIFFSFGQTWQPYLERHKELGENRPQPTALDTRLISMTVVPLNAKETVMAFEEGRESSETISMGLNQNFFFVSLEGSSQISNALERMAHRIRKLKEQDNQRLQESENMSIDQETSQLLDDCLDLQDKFDERRNNVLQQQTNPHHQYQQPQQQMEQHHLFPMEQHQLREQQQHMEQHQQVEHRQQMEQHRQQMDHQQQLGLLQQQQQHFQDLACQQQQQQLSTVGQQEHMSQPLQDRGSQLQQEYTEPPFPQLRLQPQPQFDLQEPFPDQQPMCQQADNGMVYFNWGNGKEDEVGFTPEELLKVVSLCNRLMEAKNRLPNAQ